MTEDIVLTNTQNELLDLMFYYRCATAIQLAKFVYGPLAVTTSNEKYVYGQIAKMEDEGLVLRYKPHKKISKYAVFYLSKKGFDYKLNQLSLPSGYIGSGWMDWKSASSGTVDYGHFEYSVYKPPLKQLTHHLLMIDTLLIMYPFNRITYRNNLYASRTVATGNTRTILKADAEFKIDDQVYTVEIDRSTEWHEQLVDKFENYFNYLADYRNKYGRFDIQHIVFVVDAPHDGHLKRRWTNILAAYYKSMRQLADKPELHLVTLNMLDDFLYFQLSVDKFKPNLLSALYKKYNLKLDGAPQLIDGYYKTIAVNADDAEKKYTLNYQFIATPYSTINFELRLAARNTTNATHFYIIDEPYITDKLDEYLKDPSKSYEQEIVAQYAEAQNKGELIELR